MQSLFEAEIFFFFFFKKKKKRDNSGFGPLKMHQRNFMRLKLYQHEDVFKESPETLEGETKQIVNR